MESHCNIRQHSDRHHITGWGWVCMGGGKTCFHLCFYCSSKMGSGPCLGLLNTTAVKMMTKKNPPTFIHGNNHYLQSSGENAATLVHEATWGTSVFKTAQTRKSPEKGSISDAEEPD